MQSLTHSGQQATEKCYYGPSARSDERIKSSPVHPQR